ncbi:MAG: LPXTG cell wall anchor domain-containing protein [Phycisphaerales bacterium]
MVFGHWTQTGADIWLTLIGMAVFGLILLYVVRRKK